MRKLLVRYENVLAQTYYLDKGETVPKHWHDKPHTCTVIQGQVEIEIYDGRPLLHLDTMHTKELPKLISHEIRALIDQTIIINISIGDYVTVDGMHRPADGGVLMHDGTVVYNNF